jgi:hypothetical protein
VDSFSVTLNTPGSQTITATDTVTSTIKGTATVTVGAPHRAPRRRDLLGPDFDVLSPARGDGLGGQQEERGQR